jgi:tungstate transport system substrate-binding protein
MAVNPARHPHANYPSAKKLIDWITSVEGQTAIAGFVKNNGRLFFPNFVKKGKPADE